jgi:hypothetical protein
MREYIFEVKNYYYIDAENKEEAYQKLLERINEYEEINYLDDFPIDDD